MTRSRGELSAMIKDITHQLIGCCWGRIIWTEADPAECQSQAIQDIVLYHADGEQVPVRVCETHRDLLMEISTPHEEAEHDDQR